MQWSDVADTVSRYAPAVGASLGGPMGGAVGAVVAAALGEGDNPTPDAVQAALTQDPKAAEILQKLDIARIEKEVALAQVEQQDRESARNLQKAALEAGKGEFQNWLAAGVLLGGAFLLGCIVFIPPETISDNLRMYVLGFLTAAMMQVLNYFFGSTQWANRQPRSTFPSPSPPPQTLYGNIDTRRRG